MTNLADDTVVQLRHFRSEKAGSSGAPSDGTTEAHESSGLSEWVATVRNAARFADDFVRENPWRAAGIVAVIGVGAGLLAAWLSHDASLDNYYEGSDE